MRNTTIILCAYFILTGSCAIQANTITPLFIFKQITIPTSWETIKPNRPSVYAYKIQKKDNKASIAISVAQKSLFGFFDYSKFRNAGEILASYSQKEVLKLFENTEAKDQRATINTNYIKNSLFGGIEALEIQATYEIKENNRFIKLTYFIVKGTDGWILIGLSDLSNENNIDEMKSILGKIKL